MADTIRIGGAAGFLFDSRLGASQLIAHGELDYILFEYLAEGSMAMLADSARKDFSAGFMQNFAEVAWRENLGELHRRGIKLVTNAGGVNPAGLRERMTAIAAQEGLSFRIAVVDGDNLTGHKEALAGAGYREMFTAADFPAPADIISVNAYLGAFEIARAFAMGADVVITGRVVDSALALGPLIHAFGWGREDYDLLAAGTLVGHLIECGPQATGGTFTDWEAVPDWAHIGFPIAECRADGDFVITKPPGTGGLCIPATVAEQMLYEVGDPRAYQVPDVTCDFSAVTLEAQAEDRVRVAGVRGYPPPSHYKVCATVRDGWRATSLELLLGRDAARKLERQAQAVFARTDEILRQRGWPPLRATRVDSIGAEATYGPYSRARETREVVGKLTVEHPDPAALQVFIQESIAVNCDMSVGTASLYGAFPQIGEVVRVFSFLLPRDEVQTRVDCEGEQDTLEHVPPAVFDPGMLPEAPAPAAPAGLDGPTLEVSLFDLAWGRSGDKGDSFNVAVIARRPEYLPYIRQALSVEAVAECFAHEFPGAVPGRVERFEVPGIHGLNFLLHAALDGGGAASMAVDSFAKGKAQQLLEMPIALPEERARQWRLL